MNNNTSNTDWQSLTDFVGASADELILDGLRIEDDGDCIGVYDTVTYKVDGRVGRVVGVTPHAAELVVDFRSSATSDGDGWVLEGNVVVVQKSDLSLVDSKEEILA